MPKVKVLAEGYAYKKEQKASSSVILIQQNDLNIIVDPGIDRAALLQSLAASDLKPQDINYILITHYHVDHCALMGIFPDAKIIDNSEICSFDGHYAGAPRAIPGTGIKIVPTPGHDQSHCSIIAKDDKLGHVAIAGDVIWWWDGEDQKTDRESLLNRHDEYVKDPDAINKSRMRLIDEADYIIPGHGKIFKVEK